MLHILRMNVYGFGFNTYFIDPPDIQSVPLGDVPTALTDNQVKSYVTVQSRIDNFIDLAESPWTVAAAHIGSKESSLALGYGGRFDGKDDKGRSGLSFSHCMLLESSTELQATALSIVKLFAVPIFPEVIRQLRSVAEGPADPESFVRWITGQLSDAPGERPFADFCHHQPAIRTVVHDLGGGAPLAWLGLAAQQASEKPNWEFYDTRRTSDGLFLTTCTSSGIEILASDLALKVAGNDSKQLTKVPELPPTPKPEPQNKSLEPQRTLLASSKDENNQSQKQTVDSPVLPTVQSSSYFIPFSAFLIAGLGPFAMLLGIAWGRLSTWIAVTLILGVGLWVFWAALPIARGRLAKKTAISDSRASVREYFQSILLLGAVLAALFFVGFSSRVESISEPVPEKSVNTDSTGEQAGAQRTLVATDSIFVATQAQVVALNDSLAQRDSVLAAVRDTLIEVREQRDAGSRRIQRLQTQLQQAQLPVQRDTSPQRPPPG